MTTIPPVTYTGPERRRGDYARIGAQATQSGAYHLRPILAQSRRRCGARCSSSSASMAIFAPIITRQTSTYDPAEFIKLPKAFAPPSLSHLLGTDELGRDVFARLLFGAQVSLLVGITSMLVAIFVGITLGALAGYYGGWIDNVLMRIVDAMLAIPL